MTRKNKQIPETERWIKKNWIYVVGSASIIGAATALITLLWPTSEPPHPDQNTVGGNCAQVGDNNSCIVQQQAAELSRSTGNPQQLKDNIAKISQAPPKSPGPWPYFVYDTVDVATGRDIGLKIKKAPSVRGEQVGSASAQSILWADCFVLNDYNPETGNSVDVGPKWLRIHWPTNASGPTYNTSSPQAPFLEYVYAGYALPFTHNGDIPRCS